MQADNPACEATIVSTSPDEDDIVFLTEGLVERGGT